MPPKAIVSLNLLVLGTPRCSSGHDIYLSLIPNGNLVNRNGAVNSQGVGHEGALNGVRNAFGRSFAAHGVEWNAAFCNEDTDGDGQSNGLELGDPDCVWTVGQTPSRVVDISHPAYADSRTSAAAGPTTSTGSTSGSTSGSTTTAASKAPMACAASSLTHDGTSYDCTMTFDKLKSTSLHWKITDHSAGFVDIALVKEGVGGWVSLGFPSGSGKMVGGHAVVGEGSRTDYWDMNRYDPPYNAISPTAMRVPVESATSSTQDGKLILAITGAKFADLTQADLIFGVLDRGAWPRRHRSEAGYGVNFLTGGLVEATPLMPTAVFVAAFILLCVLLFLGPFVRSARMQSRLPAFLMKPVLGRVTPIALMVFVLVVALLVVITIAPLLVSGSLHQWVLGLGSATGVVVSLPMLSASKFGVHTMFGVSRELAWRIHIFFGLLTFSFGLAHGITALVDAGFKEMAEERAYLLGLIGMPLMVLSVPPGLALIRYDWFKIVHGLAGVGYLLSFIHIIAVTRKHTTLPRVVILVVNGFALASYVLQRAHAVLSTKKAKVLSMEVASDSDGTQHVALDLQVSGFKYTPGQWVRLHIAQVGVVGHPFTIVPGDGAGRIRFVIKVTGRYTRRLARADLKGKVVRVEGPYGRACALPALEWATAVAFVAGGVGVTPALALAPQVKAKGPPALLYWAMRSESLFRLCAPSLAPHVDLALSHCQVSKLSRDTSSPAVWVPLEGFGPAPAKKELDDWLRAASHEAKRRAYHIHRPAALYVFVCGPAKLGAGVRAAVKVLRKEHPDLEVHVHEESFNFLPH